MRRLWKITFGRAARRILPVAAIGVALALGAGPNPARAQFFEGWGGGGWGGGGWGGGGGGWGSMGPRQIYQSISERGFRVLGPLRRNGSVFVADVLDRRGRHERLIVAAADGEILQRFLLQDPEYAGPRSGGGQSRQDFAPVERADRGDLVPPASVPNVGSEDDRTAVEPIRPRAAPRPIRPTRPRVVVRTPDEPAASSRDAEPKRYVPRVKLKAPADVGPAKHPSEPPTATASRPSDTPEKPSVPAPTPAPSSTTTRLSDPLAIPGAEPKAPKPAEPPKASAAATGTPANPRIVPGTVTGAPPPSPATPGPAKSTDVPVAPLD